MFSASYDPHVVSAGPANPGQGQSLGVSREGDPHQRLELRPSDEQLVPDVLGERGTQADQAGRMYKRGRRMVKVEREGLLLVCD